MKSLITACLLALPCTAGAATLNYSNEFSGSGATLTAPVSISYENDFVNGFDVVRVGFDLTGLDSQEKLTGLYLNDSDNVLNLGTVVDLGSSATITSIGAEVDQFRPDGDGYFDYLFEFANDGSAALVGGEMYEMLLVGLQLSDLAALSAPGPSESSPGPFMTAIKMQGLFDGQGSGWFNNSGIGVDPFTNPEPIPLPAAAWMFLGGIGLFARIKAKRKSQL